MQLIKKNYYDVDTFAGWEKDDHLNYGNDTQGKEIGGRLQNRWDNVFFNVTHETGLEGCIRETVRTCGCMYVTISNVKYLHTHHTLTYVYFY